MVCCFANHCPANNTSMVLSATSLIKKPHATNGLKAFTKEKKEKITENGQKVTRKHSTTQQHNPLQTSA